MGALVGRGQLGVVTDPVGHLAHHAGGLQGADRTGEARAGGVVRRGERRAVGQPGRGAQHVGVTAGAAVGDLGDAARHPAELLLDGDQVGGVHRGGGLVGLAAGHGALVLEEGLGVPEGAGSPLPAGRSAMTMDCHSWPYHGEFCTSCGAAAATWGRWCARAPGRRR